MNKFNKAIQINRYMMFFANFIIILFHVLVQAYSTKYVISYGNAHDLLENLSIAPVSPDVTFLGAMLSYFIMMCTMLMYDWGVEDSDSKVLLLIQVICGAIIGRLLGGSYTGFILLMITHTFYISKDRRTWLWMVAACIGIWLFARQDLYGTGLKLPSIYIYLSFLNNGLRHILMMLRTLLEGANFIIFLVMSLFMIIGEIDQANLIEAQLEEASKVNERLEDYIALTEEIATNQERQRIAREIHDSIGHVLTGLSAGVDASIVLLDHNPERAKTQLNLVSNSLRAGIHEVRDSLQRLRPKALENTTLHEALVKMTQDYASLTRLEIDLYDEWEETSANSDMASVVYRLIQESVTNSLRHGHADHVEVHLFSLNDRYVIVIQDDGKGSETINEGYGLNQMRERVQAVGGHIEFDGKSGFRTYVDFPKKQERLL
ncbi:MAG: sensor histidine kinase [Erysipelotrichaceae bacterium]|nr:sensor histidine kinase [Erysipelotrichaceae bacterium]